ncbi:MAG TPA: hypothetical protein PKK15_18625, partial [Kouleothrix sp.]|nr:hypothetical protein [Kouleothrix sp.]
DLTDEHERAFQMDRLIRGLRVRNTSPTAVVDEQKAEEKNSPSQPAASVDLPPYQAEQQPWYVAGPPAIKRLARAEAIPLIRPHPVLLLTVNDNEFFAVGRLLQPLPNQERVVQVSVGNETYYLGRYGAYDAVLVKTRMGSAGPGATMLVTQRAQDFWKPRATIAIGVAFGMNPSKQKIGDVLVASEIIPYNPIRAGATTLERGQRLASDAALFNRFDNTYDWQFTRPDGTLCRVHKGTVLSGEELIDNAERKAELQQRFPEAIGGEMEGTGLSAASFYERRPWILIKAICDWADGTKHSQHQPFAAAAAASLVNNVLSDPEALEAPEAAQAHQTQQPESATVAAHQETTPPPKVNPPQPTAPRANPARAAKERYLATLYRKLDAAYSQKSTLLSQVDKVTINEQIAQLEAEIKQLEQELQ